MKVIIALALLVAGANALCPNACSGHGFCDNAKDYCQCFRNWQGNDCSQRTCPYDLSFIDTPNGDLNSNGIRRGELVEFSGVHDHLWNEWESHPTDEYAVNKNEGHFYQECSNKGVCDRKSGLCKCYEGYEGRACTRVACPNQCSGHGTCETIRELAANHHGHPHATYDLWDAKKMQGCLCDEGYTGADCSLRRCPHGDDPLHQHLLNVGDDNGPGAESLYDNQADEIQTLTIGGGATTTTDSLALSFNDTFGEWWKVWVPVSAQTTDNTHHGDFCPSLVDALTSIPNGVIEGLTCSHAVDGSSNNAYSLTFVENPGDIQSLVADNSDVSISSTTGASNEFECSGRGLCDRATGICQCFRGYTDDDCSRQNALAL